MPSFIFLVSVFSDGDHPSPLEETQPVCAYLLDVFLVMFTGFLSLLKGDQDTEIYFLDLLFLFNFGKKEVSLNGTANKIF